MIDLKNHLVLTVGEPAGIGPDIVIDIANQNHACVITALVDPTLIDQRAQQLGRELRCKPKDDGTLKFGQLNINASHTLAAPARSGTLDTRNALYVYDCIKTAAKGCLSGEYTAMVTAPVHKGIINDAGLIFSGHTELIAEVCGADKPVMMLASKNLRVALATTHLPLSEVPAAINCDRLRDVIGVVSQDLQSKFGIGSPRILVCGLNPHAGEGGHLGREELDVIIPCLDTLREQGINIIGPVPADTAFAPHSLAKTDIVVAMYHDQGLPVIKAQGFGEIVNITLGLPIIRTSVDHGTALDIAGSGEASASSLLAAIEQAQLMARSLN
jgi:4-hydroxythreonine-4-phosphate dehydrogenase